MEALVFMIVGICARLIAKDKFFHFYFLQILFLFLFWEDMFVLFLVQMMFCMQCVIIRGGIWLL